MTTSTLLQRLTSEADAYAEGSYLHSLCTDAAEHIQAQQKIIEGGDVGRKVMGADLDGKTRLVDDYCDRVKELEKLVEGVIAERDYYEAEVDTLTAELKLVEQGA